MDACLWRPVVYLDTAATDGAAVVFAGSATADESVCLAAWRVGCSWCDFMYGGRDLSDIQTAAQTAQTAQAAIVHRKHQAAVLCANAASRLWQVRNIYSIVLSCGPVRDGNASRKI